MPLAKNVLVTFPLTGSGQSKTVVEGYGKAHSGKPGGIGFIQLGSTGIWQIPQDSIWTTRHSPYDTNNKRAIAEDELLELGGCVLNLAGLWGGPRDPKTFVDRVAKTRDEVKSKKSLHMIHGLDVARAIVAVTGHWSAAKGQRWMLTDGFVYDWYALFEGWADAKNADDSSVDRQPSDQARWVRELMHEEEVRVLPRSYEALGRCYDSREFWDTFKLTPLKARL